jgi:site-specific DNA-cytosine methylase
VIFWRVIDASAFVPQHRERIIIAGFRGDLYPDPAFRFPDLLERGPSLKSILDET